MYIYIYCSSPYLSLHLRIPPRISVRGRHRRRGGRAYWSNLAGSRPDGPGGPDHVTRRLVTDRVPIAVTCRHGDDAPKIGSGMTRTGQTGRPNGLGCIRWRVVLGRMRGPRADRCGSRSCWADWSNWLVKWTGQTNWSSGRCRGTSFFDRPKTTGRPTSSLTSPFDQSFDQLFDRPFDRPFDQPFDRPCPPFCQPFFDL